MKATAGLLAGVVALSLSGCSIGEDRRGAFERAAQAEANNYIELGMAHQRFIATLEDRFAVTIEDASIEEMASSAETEWLVDGVKRSCRVSALDQPAEVVGIICEGKPLREVKETR